MMTVISDGWGLPALRAPETGTATAVAGSRGRTNAVAEDLGGGILRITLQPGSRITREDGTTVRDQFLALSSGAGAAVLLQITGVESISREAVRFFSEAATITAFAILGSTPVDRVLAHGLRGLPAPHCPTRYFSDERQALSWLQGGANGHP